VAATKICRGCGLEKSLTEFNKAQPKADGTPRWQSQCKPCRAQWAKDNAAGMNAGARARRAKQPEKQKKKDRATYRRRHKQELERGRKRRATPEYQERQDRWRSGNAEHLQEYDVDRNRLPERKAVMEVARKKFVKAKPDRAKELWKKSHRENRLANNARAAIRREKNRDAINAKMRQRKKDNFEVYYAYGHARRARLKANGGKWTPQEIAEIRVRQNDCCAFCTTPLNGRGERDHIVPPGYGGTNDGWNIQLTCSGPASCNRKKNDTHPIVFMLRVRAGLVRLRTAVTEEHNL
jgi:hypothetical protein